MCFRKISDKEVVTRKLHRCVWCNEVIDKGATARARVHDIGGDLRSDHMHIECYDASGEVAKTEGCFEFSEGEYVRGSTELVGA